MAGLEPPGLTARKDTALATRAVEAQDKGSVLAMKAVEAQGKGGVPQRRQGRRRRLRGLGGVDGLGPQRDGHRVGSYQRRRSEREVLIKLVRRRVVRVR